MIFKKLFKKNLPVKSKESEILQAVVTLLAEVMRADFKVEDSDMFVFKQILKDVYRVDDSAANFLIDEALAIENRPTSYHSFITIFCSY